MTSIVLDPPRNLSSPLTYATNTADMVRTRPTRLDISGTTRLKFETTEAMVGTPRASLARRYHASPVWTWASMSAHL